jgi:hypothetical protein
METREHGNTGIGWETWGKTALCILLNPTEMGLGGPGEANKHRRPRTVDSIIVDITTKKSGNNRGENSGVERRVGAALPNVEKLHE